MHLCQKGILMKLLIVFGTESAFPFLVPMNDIVFHHPTTARSPTCNLSATQHLYCTHNSSLTRSTPIQLHICKFSVSQSCAVRFVLQVPWHKPASQEANHIKSMSHVAAYTGSEALSGVMLDIVLYPHTVTHILQPQFFWEVSTPNLSL